jgi:hypothetical protein
MFNDTLMEFSVYTNLSPIGFNAGSYTFEITGSIASGSSATITVSLTITNPIVSMTGTNMSS